MDAMSHGQTKTATASERSGSERPPLGVILLHYKRDALQGWSSVINDVLGIGREPGPSVGLALSADDRVSRTHATVARQGDAFLVRDLGSRNGTFVDGRRVTEALVPPGSILRVGDSLLYCGELASDPPVTQGSTIGQSLAFLGAWAAASRVATTTLPVLLIGETGTGKEGFGRRIHELSGRGGPLVTVNCGAVPEALAESLFFGHRKGAFTGAAQESKGHFATAAEGTLFLDEVGELPASMQPKLLRVLDDGRFTEVGSSAEQRTSARIVSATNVDLEAAVSAGKFRADLYARLSSYVIRLPPLRDRRADIVMLATRFYESFAGTKPDWPADAWEKLLLHDWPLNARELRSVVQRLSVDRVARSHVVEALAASLAAPPRVTERGAERVDDRAAEREAAAPRAAEKPAPSVAEPQTAEEMRALLAEHNGNIRRLAELTGRSRRQVYRWLERFGLDPNDYREGD